jgi:hypothetical protein
VVAFRSSKETRTDTFLESVGIGVVPVTATADLETGLTPEKCADSTINNFKEKYRDFALLESTPTTAAGLPAQQAVLRPVGESIYMFLRQEEIGYILSSTGQCQKNIRNFYLS